MLLYGVMPFEAAEQNLIYDKIKMVNFTFPADSSVSDLAKDLIKNLLVKRPESRLKPEQILQHKFFRGYIPEKIPSEFLKTAPSKQYLYNCEHHSNHYMFDPMQTEQIDFVKFEQDKIGS